MDTKAKSRLRIIGYVAALATTLWVVRTHGDAWLPVQMFLMASAAIWIHRSG